MDNTLVELTRAELNKQAHALSVTKEIDNMVDSDTYVDDMTLLEFNYFTSLVSDDDSYTVAQYKYIIDRAITIATM